MGATVNAYWPGITKEQIEESHPGFYNDDKPWGDWMANREEEPEVLDAIKRLKAEAILSYKTGGWDDEEVSWVTPQQLRDAAEKLREAVRAGLPEAKIILKTYELSANRLEPVADQFIHDLDDIVSITKWAEDEGATRMTLEVNW